ncbi:unnamed protein product [Lampetra fluviatilis]
MSGCYTARRSQTTSDVSHRTRGASSGTLEAPGTCGGTPGRMVIVVIVVVIVLIGIVTLTSRRDYLFIFWHIPEIDPTWVKRSALRRALGSCPTSDVSRHVPSSFFES